MPSLTRYLVAIAVGAAYGWLAPMFWRYYLAVSPVPDWLLENFAKPGHVALYNISSHSLALLMNVILAAPAAVALVAYRRSNSWQCALTAASAAVLTAYWGMEFSSLLTLISSGHFWLGVVLAFLPIPIAFVVFRAVRRQPALP
jgi:hypothetical protein